MKKPTRFSLTMLISVAALLAAVSAPAVFAEDGHAGGGHDGDRDRGHDDVVTTVTTTNAATTLVRRDNDDNDVNEPNEINDNDVNDDHGVHAAVTTPAGAAVVQVEDDND